MTDLDTWRREQGYLLAFWIEPPAQRDSHGGLATNMTFPGRLVAVTRTATDAAQIIAGTLGSVTDRWTFPTTPAAVTALILWKASGWAGEPEGWMRHQPSNRRRSYSDDDGLTPMDEWVAP